MLCGICWHLSSSQYIPYSIYASGKRIRVEPCVTQSFLQLLVPGASDFVFTYVYKPQAPESVLFTLKHSLTGRYTSVKNTLNHKSRLEHATVICRQALLTHTPHLSGVICVSDLQACTLCGHFLNYTHSHKSAHAQSHTVNTTNAFSSTKNNTPPVLANVNIYPACLRYSGQATWLRQKLPGLTVHSQWR